MDVRIVSSDFINLDRCFIPLKEGEVPSLTMGSDWGRQYGGWLDWKQLLAYRRVVLLAEADCGKTEEFRHQARTLRDAGSAAFFARIEDLEGGIDDALHIGYPAEFETWRDGGPSGFFFLDSVDEARITGKRFDKALRRLARDIGPDALHRAHIFVSCRVSDWRGATDRKEFLERLPLDRKPEPPPVIVDDWKKLLLSPLHAEWPFPFPDVPKSEPCIVQLAPLNDAQVRHFIAAKGIRDVVPFMDALHRKRLEVLAERPRDLLFLIGSWAERKAFGNLHEMADIAIRERLSEVHPSTRADSDHLSYTRALAGAERLAAGLVLGRSFTLRAPDSGMPPDKTCLDPADLLPDWTDTERATLLRRSLFAPATYGRVRFHHRWVQEFLAACWLRGVLQISGNRQSVDDLLFAKPYGIETTIPSMRPVAAWLALWDEQVRSKIIGHTPLALVQYGDPAGLSIDDRSRLLRTAAEMHANGRIADTYLDNRNLSLFAEPDMAPAIHDAWQANPREDFRSDLLRLVAGGIIRNCAGLARQMALDETMKPHSRVIAAEALKACADRTALADIVGQVTSDPSRVPMRLATGLASVLFPDYMTIEQLLRLVADVPIIDRTEAGFGKLIVNLFRSCGNLELKLTFADGLARLCELQDYAEDYLGRYPKHDDIVQQLSPIALELMNVLGYKPHSTLIRLLTTVFLGQWPRLYPGEDRVALYTELGAHDEIRYAVIWSAAKAALPQGSDDVEGWRYGDPPLTILLPIQNDDLPYFKACLRDRPSIWERRFALYVIGHLLPISGRLVSEDGDVIAAIRDVPELWTDLSRHRAPQDHDLLLTADQPPPPPPAMPEKIDAMEMAEAALLAFRSLLRDDPGQLRIPAEPTVQDRAVQQLWQLACWTWTEAGQIKPRPFVDCRKMEVAFGLPVSTAFKDNMRLLWRRAVPQEPIGTQDNSSLPSMAYLCVAGICMEAGSDRTWARHLVTVEAKRAAEHACLFRQGRPLWFDDLLATYPHVVEPLLISQIEQEMLSASPYAPPFNSHFPFISHYIETSSMVPEIVRGSIIESLEQSEPGSPDAFRGAIAILLKTPLPAERTTRLVQVTTGRLRGCMDDNAVFHHLALLFALSPESGVEAAETWVGTGEKADARATQLLARLFSPSRPGTEHSPLSRLSVLGLERLLGLAFRHVRPQDDRIRENAFHRDDRTDAEPARNMILQVLIDKNTFEARAVLLRIGATQPPFSKLIFQELAQGMAERAATTTPWSPTDVVRFEQQALLPARNGEELLSLVRRILDDIQNDLSFADASSRAALRACPDENAVQGWLAEQLKLRAHGRFTATQETINHRRDRLDILVQVSASPDQLAIEIKHGGKGWSVANLLAALERQLGEGYLLPDRRRHGILLVTHHGRPRRHWRHPHTGSPLSFPGLVALLQDRADALTRAGHDALTVCVVGLDAALADTGAASGRRPKAKAPSPP